MSRRGDKKKFVFGINNYTAAICRITPIDGCIDDFTEKTTFNGVPIIGLSAVPAGSLVVSVVNNSRPITALAKLKKAGIEEFLDYFSFAEASRGELPQLEAIKETRIDYNLNKDEYKSLRDLFADEESRAVFDSVIKFRVDADLGALKGFSFSPESQYFADFINYTSREVFIDGGGYDGFTTLQFVKRCPNYSRVHFFEPSKEILSVARRRLAAARDICFHEVGIYDFNGMLSFNSRVGSASHISESGCERVRVARLDDELVDSPTFIKLDLEGAESQALSGMREHILKNHPKLAIAVYHRPSDFRDIPALVLETREDYSVYLRHYTEGWTETVMYFIPLE